MKIPGCVVFAEGKQHFPFPSQVALCAKGAGKEEKRVMEAAGVSTVEFALFFFFPCTHPSFIVFNVLQFSRLHFDISKQGFVLALLTQLNSPDRSYQSSMFSCELFLSSIRMSSASSPWQQEQGFVARTLLENSINQ